MRPENGGARLGIVFNGSPLFSGGAGRGESEIRKWIIEHDMLEAIIALPDQLFYNTGISTYVWIVTNRKEKERKGKIQLINATAFFKKMAKSLGNKRNEIGEDHIAEITKIYGTLKNGEYCKIFKNEYFGYTRVTVERPLRLNFQASQERIDKIEDKEIKKVLNRVSSTKIYKNREKFVSAVETVGTRQASPVSKPAMKIILKALSERDETADICLDKNGNPEADTELRDAENVPLSDDIEKYFKREVLPHVPDAWMDRSKDKVGYEINFTKEFYKYKPLRNLEEIRKDIIALEKETEGLLKEI